MALFVVGLTTFVSLYSTQALLPELSQVFRVSPTTASLLGLAYEHGRWPATVAYGLALLAIALVAAAERRPGAPGEPPTAIRKWPQSSRGRDARPRVMSVTRRRQ